MHVLVERKLRIHNENFGFYSDRMLSDVVILRVEKMRILKCIQNASRLILKASRHVKICFGYVLGDVGCLTASYLPGNQVDGLPGIAVVLGRQLDHRPMVKIEVRN